jgi:hypothetical protein
MLFFASSEAGEVELSRMVWTVSPPIMRAEKHAKNGIGNGCPFDFLGGAGRGMEIPLAPWAWLHPGELPG